MNDGQALYQAICENPDEDTPRLVYADWLDEQGEHEYAQYIRWSISIVNPPDEESFENVLDWGEREKWCRAYEVMDKYNLAKGIIEIDDDFMKFPEDYPLDLYCDSVREIRHKRGTINALTYNTSQIFLSGMYNVGSREGTYWTHLAERLMRETPITQLVLRDVYPYQHITASAQMLRRMGRVRAQYKYRWLQMTEDDAGDMDDISDASFEGMLPQWLFDLMWYSKLINTCNKATVMTQSQTSTRYIEFNTREQAKEALGEVLGRDIRERVYGAKK